MNWGREISAGLTVGIVALPLALAFGIASGATPAAGLYTAIIAGTVAGIFGGSRYQITGPTGAMSVILIGIIAQYGISGMLIAGLMAGVLQIIFGTLKLGRLINLIPHSVIVGFTNGIAIVILLGQLKYIAGAPLLTTVVVVTIFGLRRLNKVIPASLIGLAVGIALEQLWPLGAPTVQAIPATLPVLVWPHLDWAMVIGLLKPAVSIALLGSIESLLSAAVADNMTGTVHNSNRELVGQGLGNIAAAFFGGVPGTGAIARTAVNINNGGQTRWVSIIQSLFLLGVLLILGPWTSYIPLAALSGILVVTCYDMFDFENIRALNRGAFADGVVLLATMALTVFTDLIVAVVGGVLLATLIYAYRGSLLQIKSVSHVNNVAVYSLHGPLFFGTVDQLTGYIKQLPSCETLILDLSDLCKIDLTGALALSKLQQLGGARRFSQLVLCGLSSENRSILEHIGIIKAEHMVAEPAQYLASVQA